MKKIILLLLFISVSVFSQETKYKTYIEAKETISSDQYNLIKKINSFYPDLILSKQIKNIYKSDLKEKVLIQSYLIIPTPLDCTSYNIFIYPDNTRINYDYNIKGKGPYYGNVTIFNGDVYRTIFKVDGTSRISKYYINGKLINEKKNQ